MKRMCIEAAPSDPGVKWAPSTHSPRFSETLILIELFKSDELRYEVDPAISGTSCGRYAVWICNLPAGRCSAAPPPPEREKEGEAKR